MRILSDQQSKDRQGPTKRRMLSQNSSTSETHCTSCQTLIFDYGRRASLRILLLRPLTSLKA
jgi:hypothetical protein